MVILVVEAVPQHKTHIMKRYYLHFLPCITYIYIIYIASRFSTYKMNTHFMFFVNLLMFTNKWQQKRVDIHFDILFSLCYHWISMFGGNWKMPAPVPAYSAEFQLTIIFFMPWPVPGLHADLKRNFFLHFWPPEIHTSHHLWSQRENVNTLEHWFNIPLECFVVETSDFSFFSFTSDFFFFSVTSIWF